MAYTADDFHWLSPLDMAIFNGYVKLFKFITKEYIKNTVKWGRTVHLIISKVGVKQTRVDSVIKAPVRPLPPKFSVSDVVPAPPEVWRGSCPHQKKVLPQELQLLGNSFYQTWHEQTDQLLQITMLETGTIRHLGIGNGSQKQAMIHKFFLTFLPIRHVLPVLWEMDVKDEILGDVLPLPPRQNVNSDGLKMT